MNNIWFKRADILLPVNVDLTKWSVVACDQYTSEPDYWRRVEDFVVESPSTLRMTLPEAYLESEDVEQRIDGINHTMRRYLDAGFFRELTRKFVYVERTLAGGAVRKGLIGAVDLEGYDYNKGSESPVRATEGTVLERIPPRVRVRRDAALELPHIMLLIDDEKRSVIEPLAARKQDMEQCYDFELMQGGGRVAGYVCGEREALHVENSLSGLACEETFRKKYGVKDGGLLLFAVGDGNHSLATAKECYECLKAEHGAEAVRDHPARYALVEVVNVHDEALRFEPIHRVVFGVNPRRMLVSLSEYYDVSFEPCEGQAFRYITKSGSGTVYVKNPVSHLPVGTLQAFLDDYIGRNGGRMDYIHGKETVLSLGAQEGNIGFLLPKMEKSDLFQTVILDGALPKKTFSMGRPEDKRFYLECRKIRP